MLQFLRSQFLTWGWVDAIQVFEFCCCSGAPLSPTMFTKCSLRLNSHVFQKNILNNYKRGKSNLQKYGLWQGKLKKTYKKRKLKICKYDCGKVSVYKNSLWGHASSLRDSDEHTWLEWSGTKIVVD